MQRTTSGDVDLSHDDLVQVIRRAEIARMRFLRENSVTALKAIGWTALTVCLGLLVVAGYWSSQRQILENTAQMERFATKLRAIEKIAPAALNQIDALLRKPEYDCQAVRCDAALERRNSAVRLELEGTLAKHSIPATVAATH